MMRENKKYMSTKDIRPEACYMGRAKNCGTCMYCDNLRDRYGFRISELESGMFNFCTKAPREGVTQ